MIKPPPTLNTEVSREVRKDKIAKKTKSRPSNRKLDDCENKLYPSAGIKPEMPKIHEAFL